MRSSTESYVVWMHSNARVDAVGHFETRHLAESYCDYCNRRMPDRWFEVRRCDVEEVA